ncbi:PilZ domain-containing protein [Thermodesulfobacteriota bacterium]
MKQEEKNPSCPYWMREKGTKECKITKGGLYIPLPKHIDMFCQTERFDQCGHFVTEHDLYHDKMMLNSPPDSDRRLYRRINGNYSLLFSPFQGVGLQKEVVEKEARTIDISLGGMQIESRDEIPASQMMYFSFGKDFAGDVISGIGEVKWCRTAEEEAFLTGVSFTFLNNDMKHALRNRISMTMT